MAPDLKIVKGRMDVEATSLPLTQVVTHGSVRIGFLEGFTLVSNEPDLLLAEANRLDVDVLCWGGTHRFECFEYMDKFFVNPGSATGAFTTNWAPVDEGSSDDVVPSFCLMDVCLLPISSCLCSYAVTRWDFHANVLRQVQGISLTLYVYQLRKDANGVENVAVEKVTYTKPVEPTGAP